MVSPRELIRHWEVIFAIIAHISRIIGQNTCWLSLSRIMLPMHPLVFHHSSPISVTISLLRLTPIATLLCSVHRGLQWTSTSSICILLTCPSLHKAATSLLLIQGEPQLPQLSWVTRSLYSQSISRLLAPHTSLLRLT